jgi:hypothetical protein
LKGSDKSEKSQKNPTAKGTKSKKDISNKVAILFEGEKALEKVDF